MGALAVALAANGGRVSPLDRRLGRLLWQGLPLIAGGGAAVTIAGLVWGRALIPQLALGASVAVAAVPEGLPLLAGVAEAGVARRLSRRNALVSRLASVEALGRVDIACADKTGTLTQGRLALTHVEDADGASASPRELTHQLRRVLGVAAVASPHPDAFDAGAHPTDVAVAEAAMLADLGRQMRAERQREARFDPGRGFQAALADGRLSVKGAAEALVPRCRAVLRDGQERPLDAAGRRHLLARAEELAGRGLRVLMVAEGAASRSPEDPGQLTALGFIGISDPLRPSVPEAVRRCAEAGVRVIMLTGDHPATALAIAREAGLPSDPEQLLTGPELAELADGELCRRLERTAVIARSTPLDKVRIVEALQGLGHTVAMTGDGVNDAPALRLADVGVAMGEHGTEVARQAADLVVLDDDFATLVEALVEGRAFWRNMRRALGLLLGGNAGEVGLMMGAGIAGLASPLTTRQVLTVNLVTDVLPAVAIATQPPEHRNLAALAREGRDALDGPLRREILARATATTVPSLVAYVLAALTGPPAAASTVAFATIVTTQLGQTVELGLSEGRLSAPVAGAVGGSLAFMAAAVSLPPLRAFLGLSALTPAGLLLVGGATVTATVLGRALRFEAPPANAAAG
jgi:magnesium-transporting ATPase (P-type)